MGGNRRYPDMRRSWTVEEWNGGKFVVLHDKEVFAEALDAFNAEVKANPNRFLTMSQGRIIYKHPDTDWKIG